jgi:mRNA-degrading endonuclease RelE of RelBE toxin-antitoxin system
MAERRKFSLVFAPEVLEHLDAIERKYYRLIKKSLDMQLTSAPDKPTRNRKPLEEPLSLGATWELRFGPQNRFRVFYEIDRREHRVHVLAIGVKEGNRLFIGGEEIEL